MHNSKDYYVLKSQTGAIFVKEAGFFEAQGGLVESWGRKWRKVHASSIEHARSIAERWITQNPKKWPHLGREAKPLSEQDVADETMWEMLERVGTDAKKWAEEFVRIVTSPHFEKENLIEVGFLTGWFANAIEAGRSAGLKETESSHMAGFKEGFKAGRRDFVRDMIDKAGVEDQLKEKVRKAKEAYDRLTPEEKKAHDDAQRESWVRGEMGIAAAERTEGRHTRMMRADYSKLEERVIGDMLNNPKNQDSILGTVTGRFNYAEPERKFKSHFGHHPEPIIDYEVEVGELEAALIDMKAGLDHAMSPEDFEERLDIALDFKAVTPQGVKARRYLKEKVRGPYEEWRRTKNNPQPAAVDRFAELMGGLRRWLELPSDPMLPVNHPVVALRKRAQDFFDHGGGRV